MVKEQHVIDLIPAYALDSLDELEAVQVEAHLSGCEACQAELRAYQAVVAALPLALPDREPPSRVKEGLMERVRAATPSDAARPAPRASLQQSLVNFFRSAAPVWGVASFVLILLLATSTLLLWRQVSQLNRNGSPVAMRVINLSSTTNAPQATGVIVISMDGDSGTLVVDHLPPLSSDKQYQLWLIQDGNRTSGGVFSVDPQGYGSLWVTSPRPLVDYSTFGITIEPQGGSPGPTGEKVLGGSL